MVHKQGDKHQQGKRRVRIKKSDRRPDDHNALPDVPATGLPSSEPCWVKREDGKVEVDAARLIVEPLIGRPYIPGKQDCGALIRDFYSLNTGILFPDYARPDDWWQKGMNLFYEIYRDEGFHPVNITVAEMQIGDVMLMAYGCQFPNHSGLYIGNGQILQHLHGKLSSRENIRSHNRDALLAIVRRPDIIIKAPPQQELNLVDMLSPYWKQRLSAKLGGLDEHKVKEEIKRLGEEQAARTAAAAAQSKGN